MSRAIFAVDNTAARPRKWRGFLAYGRTLLVLLALLGSQSASADPVKADQALQFIHIQYPMLKMYFQAGKSLAQSGQTDAARTNFQSAYYQSIMLNIDVLQLSLENVDSLQNGQCNDCSLQEKAVTYSRFAEAGAMVLQYHLMNLSQVPTSQASMSQIDYQILMLDLDLQQAEYYTYAAQ